MVLQGHVDKGSLNCGLHSRMVVHTGRCEIVQSLREMDLWLLWVKDEDRSSFRADREVDGPSSREGALRANTQRGSCSPKDNA